jgi:multicomponent K+:H+ antiporter subunit E
MRPFPAPILSAMLFVGWLLLVGSVSAGHIALAATLATAIPLWSERLRPDRARVGAWGEVVRLAIIVLYDIVASAFVVARQILGPEDRIRPGFVWVP